MLLHIFSSSNHCNGIPAIKLTAYVIYFSSVIISIIIKRILSSDGTHDLAYFPATLSWLLLLSGSENFVFWLRVLLRWLLICITWVICWDNIVILFCSSSCCTDGTEPVQFPQWLQACTSEEYISGVHIIPKGRLVFAYKVPSPGEPLVLPADLCQFSSAGVLSIPLLLTWTSRRGQKPKPNLWAHGMTLYPVTFWYRQSSVTTLICSYGAKASANRRRPS